MGEPPSNVGGDSQKLVRQIVFCHAVGEAAWEEEGLGCCKWALGARDGGHLRRRPLGGPVSGCRATRRLLSRCRPLLGDMLVPN